MRTTCLNSIYELAKKDKRVIFIGSDLGFGVLADMARELPGQFLMLGVAEQNMIGLAAGLALEGKIVYVNTIATFLTRRCYEQIALDVALHNLPVRLVGNGGGCIYAPLGPTHIATDDIALMRNLGITVIAPADKVEMAALMPQTADYPGPLYIRLGAGLPIVTDGKTDMDLAIYYGIFESWDVKIITTGNMLKVCLDAKDLLEAQGIKVKVVHIPVIQDQYGSNTIEKTNKLIITVEEHSTVNGLGALAAEHLPVAYRFGLPLFPEGYGSWPEMLARYGLTAENIAEKAKGLFNGQDY